MSVRLTRNGPESQAKPTPCVSILLQAVNTYADMYIIALLSTAYEIIEV